MTTITGSNVYDLMTSPAMDPALTLDRSTGDVDARSSRYAADFPERYETIITRDDALAIDHVAEYAGEGEPSDEWCAMVADVLNA